MVTAWRIVKRKHAKSAFSGEGARRYGGRWNNPGIAAIYTAQSQSLAALEIAVHLESPELLEKYVVIEVTFDESLVGTVSRASLPKNWRASHPPDRVRAIGDSWVEKARSAVLRVPSTIIPAEFNYLINPRHPDFTKVHFGKPSPFQFDPRLAAK
jgi:RES domain-containing protein